MVLVGVVHSREASAKHRARRRACQDEECEMMDPNRRCPAAAVFSPGVTPARNEERSTNAQHKNGACCTTAKQKTADHARPVRRERAYRRRVLEGLPYVQVEYADKYRVLLDYAA